MSRHVYLAVTCKTAGCKTACILAYIGLYEGESEIGATVPESFDFQCGECHQTHHYNRREVYPVITSAPPPEGFESQF